MANWIIGGLAFFGAFLAVIAANAVLTELASRERRRINEEVRSRLYEQLRARVPGLVIRRPGQSRSKLMLVLDGLITQSGLNITAQRLVFLAVAMAVIGGTACWVLSDNVLFAAPIAAAGCTAPLLFVLRARQKRRDKLLVQLPDTFDAMSRVLRSGQTISRAMKIVADDGTPPISLEFLYCHEQMDLGMTPEAALRELAARTGVLEIKIFTVAVLVQRQTGGNLSGLFDKMGSMVRERFRIRGMIQSLTSQGRLQAILLSSLPIAMFALLMVIQPDYERQLLDYPSLVAAALGLIALGGLWIRNVVNFDY